MNEDYADYVEHPRFGKAPRFTGLDPNPNDPGVNLHWRTSYHPTLLIPGTAIKADLSRQTESPAPVTHYYDLDRTCVDCHRKFLFFAEEQKFWYEELGFPLDSDSVRCTACRKRLQHIAHARRHVAPTRRRYEQLFALDSRGVEETLEMVDCCLTLIEEAEFSPRQCERVRMLLKRVPEDRRSGENFRDLTARLYVAERQARDRRNAASADDPIPSPGNVTPGAEQSA